MIANVKGEDRPGVTPQIPVFIQDLGRIIRVDSMPLRPPPEKVRRRKRVPLAANS